MRVGRLNKVRRATYYLAFALLAVGILWIGVTVVQAIVQVVVRDEPVAPSIFWPAVVLLVGIMAFLSWMGFRLRHRSRR